jgi:hypothetical protein
MKLATLYFDDHVVIPGGRQLGDMTGELRSDAFRSVDGWDIHETLPGVFSLVAPWMTEPVTIGGYGYSYTRAPIEPVDTEAPVVAPRKGKR